MPRLASGPATRTHGVRPSEKNAFRVISGSSPQGDPRCARPRRGGAGSARPHENALASPWYAPARPPGVPLSRMIMSCLGLRLALQRGRTECVPPRKSPLASSPALPRKAILARTVHPWRGGLCTPAWEAMPSPGDRPLGHRACVHPSMIMPYLGFGSGPATRTCRAHPSEKTTSPFVSGFSPQGHLTLARPPEGRALHARMRMPWLHPGMPPLGHRGCVHPSMIMPYPGFGSGLATRARRPRPSEKTTLRVISGHPSARSSV